MRLEDHGNLLQRGVTGTFTDAIDGNLYLTGTSQHACYGIGCSHTQVVMAMSRQYTLPCSKGINMFIQVFYFLVILVWYAETGSIRNITNRSTRLGYSFNNASQIFIICSTSILGIELNILYIFLGILDSSYRTLYNLFGCRIELITNMTLTGTDTGMDSFMLGILQCLSSHIYIFLYGTGQCTNGWPCHSLTDFYYRVEIAGATNGESRLDDINAKRLQLTGYLNFLHCIQLASGNLFAITQCSVENKQSVTHFMSFV